MKRVYLVVIGRVQQVFYRRSVQKKAQELGLMGWARNTEDGSVEIIAEGPNEKVDEFIKWCWEGPPLAKVEDVQIEEQDHGGEFETFEII